LQRLPVVVHVLLVVDEHQGSATCQVAHGRMLLLLLLGRWVGPPDAHVPCRGYGHNV
jgi:hypothetical protein